MASIVEKPDGTMVVFVHLSLKPGRDVALINIIKLSPKRGLAGIVREAMRDGICEDHSQRLDEEVPSFEIPDVGIDL
jgi:hypothetical protein